MTIHRPTNNPLATLPTGAEFDVPVQNAGLDVSVLNQLAAEFFSALPNQHQNTHGFNFDLPSHQPQPKDPVLALAGRIPSVAQQLDLNPSSAKHYVDPTADHPERRLASSAPMIGGAHTPDVFATLKGVDVKAPTEQTPVHLSQNAQPSTASASPYYFLDFAQPESTHVLPQHRQADVNQTTQYQADPRKTTTNAPVSVSLGQLDQDPYAFDEHHVIDDRQLKSILKDRNDKPATTASSFYFLDTPTVDSHYSPAKHDAQFPSTAQQYQPLDLWKIRQDFPILAERVNGKQLVWLDNAATTHKPQVVIDRISHFYQHENSNIHRAAHELAARASDAYEHARDVVARFIGAPSSQNIVFVRGTTEGINLIAKTWGKQNIGAGDEIIVSHLEHHANIVPWYQLSKETGAVLRVIPVDDTGQIKLEEFSKLLNPRTKLVSITQVSNALGTVTPTAEVIALAHAAGVRVLVDGAQSVSHMPTNVSALGADFFVFSGHKVFGPTGIGAVYAKSELLDTMPVWEGGGNMIQDVTFENIIYQPAPNKFEAGTGNIADAVGLGAALEYVESLGIHNIARYEHDLLEYGQHALQSVSGLRLIGTAANKASVMSFTLEGYNTEEVGKVLNQHGIAVRSGHHCAQPILRRFGVEKTVRPSLAFYNTTEEIDRLVAVLHQLRRGRTSRL